MNQTFSSQARVQSFEASEPIAFSPTSLFRILFEGGAGLPDFFEERSQKGDSPPLHKHPWPSWELVITGQLRFQIGEQMFVAKPGDMIYVPPDVPHSYLVESEHAHTVGINLSDGRFPVLQRQAAPLMVAPAGPDFEKIMALAQTQGVEILGPPLTEQVV